MGKTGKAQISLSAPTQSIALNYDTLRKTVVILRAVNHPIREAIMEMLQEKENMKVTDIYVKLRLEQSVASQHLAILRKAGVVNTERQGKFIYYHLNETRVAEINQLVGDLAKNPNAQQQ
jgi:DNA-binding transcriptional ArsR family regulator